MPDAGRCPTENRYTISRGSVKFPIFVYIRIHEINDNNPYIAHTSRSADTGSSRMVFFQYRCLYPYRFCPRPDGTSADEAAGANPPVEVEIAPLVTRPGDPGCHLGLLLCLFQDLHSPYSQ